MSRAPDGLTMPLCTPQTNMESEGIAPLILNFGTVTYKRKKLVPLSRIEPPFLGSYNIQLLLYSRCT